MMDGQMVHVDARHQIQTPDNRQQIQTAATGRHRYRQRYSHSHKTQNTKHKTKKPIQNTEYRYKRDKKKKNSQNPLVRVPHLLIQPRLMHTTGHRISSLHFRRVVESQVDIVNGLSAVGHGDATSQCRGQIPA